MSRDGVVRAGGRDWLALAGGRCTRTYMPVHQLRSAMELRRRGQEVRRCRCDGGLEMEVRLGIPKDSRAGGGHAKPSFDIFRSYVSSKGNAAPYTAQLAIT